MKKLMLLVALVALVAVTAGAQDVRKSLGDYVVVKGTEAIMNVPFAQPATNPKYCPKKTCLFYSGDFNSSNSDANGLYNGQGGAIGSGGSAYVYGAFKVPKGKTWTVTYLGINTLSDASTVDPTAPYDVRTGVTSGSGGKDTTCTGTGKDTWVATGRSGFGLTEYTNEVKLKKACSLKGGTKGTTYFMNVLTSCLTSSCTSGAVTYESDQETNPGPNHVGTAAVWDDAYFNSSTFGDTWVETWGSSGACGNIGCDEFSMFAIGTVK